MARSPRIVSVSSVVGAIVAVGIAFGFGVHVGVNSERPRTERLTIGNSSAIAADSAYTALLQIESNRADVAKRLLEETIFMDLDEVWDDGREDGEIADQSTKELFLRLYPKVRTRVSFTNFILLPQSVQTDLSSFMLQADAYINRSSSQTLGNH